MASKNEGAADCLMADAPIQLFGYFRSSTTYRLRIALNLKGLDFDYIPVSLVKGEQRAAGFVARDPFASVPLLGADGRDRAQAMALLQKMYRHWPFFLALLFSIIEFGRATYYVQMLNNAAREGARYCYNQIVDDRPLSEGEPIRA